MSLSAQDARGPAERDHDHERAWRPAVPKLLREPERVGLVEADIAAGIPRPVAFLRHVAHLGADHDRRHDAVHGADREYLVDIDRQHLLPHLAASILVACLLPLVHQLEELTGSAHVPLLALLALVLVYRAPARPFHTSRHC